MSDQTPNSIDHPCPACDTTIDARAVLDGTATDGPGRRCPACRTDIRVLFALADGLVDRGALDRRADGRLELPAAVRTELAEREVADRADPAERNDYLAAMGVSQ